MMGEWFVGLPDAARLWVTVLDRPLDDAHRQDFEAGLRGILEGWSHKGQVYQAAYALVESQILLIAEPVLAEAPSGCAIDGMLRRLCRLATDANVRIAQDHEVVLRISGCLEIHPRTELFHLVESHRIGPDTLVVDRSLQDLAQLRAGRLERPIALTWIGRKHGLSHAL